MSTKRSKVITVAAAGALTVALGASVAAATLSSSPAPMPATADAFLTTTAAQAAAAQQAAPGSQQAVFAGQLRAYQTERIDQQFAAQKSAAIKSAEHKAEAAKKAAKKVTQEHAARQAPAQTAAVTTPSGSPEQIAEQMLSQFGWSASQFSCLQPLWEHESGWSLTAENPSSGAYGIPQALPGSQMASAGPDWQTNPATQIRWGLTYIQSRYGSPCGAWAHEEADGWY
jgi:hypothetical protein